MTMHSSLEVLFRQENHYFCRFLLCDTVKRTQKISDIKRHVYLYLAEVVRKQDIGKSTQRLVTEQTIILFLLQATPTSLNIRTKLLQRKLLEDFKLTV